MLCRPTCALTFPMLASVFFTVTCTAADDVPDPWSSIHPRFALQGLKKLRPLLNASPKDARLQGMAIMFYVNLSLEGEAELNGGCGPWLRYAHELAIERAALRNGAQPSSLAEAAPELWVELIEGNAQAVEQALNSWPDQQGNPIYRTLHALATRDWRPLANLEQPTPHERYAQLSLGLATGASAINIHVQIDDPELNPVVVAHLKWREMLWGRPESIVENTVAEATFALENPEFDEATVKAKCSELLNALGVSPDPALIRKDLITKARLAASHTDPGNAKAISVAFQIAELGLNGSRGLRAPDGSFRFFGLGDISEWNRDRLYWAAFYAYLANKKQNRDAFAASLLSELPDSLCAARLGMGYYGLNLAPGAPPPAADNVNRLDAAIRKSLSEPHPPSVALLCHAVYRLTSVRGRDGSAELVRLVAAHREKQGGLGRAGLESLANAAMAAEVDFQLLVPALRAAALRDPWDREIFWLSRPWQPEAALLNLAGLTPSVTWIDANIDNAVLPWPNTKSSVNFGIVWTGELRIAQPGSYNFAVESDDGARLVLGENVINNWGEHPLKRSSSNFDLAAKSYPLRVEYFQGSGAAACRLLWQPPGKADLTPVPADALSHAPDHVSGLNADFYAGNYSSLMAPCEDEIRRAGQMPYDAIFQSAIGKRLFTANRFDEAKPYLERTIEIRKDNFHTVLLAQTWLRKNPPDVAKSFAIFQDDSGHFLATDAGNLAGLIERLEELNLQHDFLEAMTGHWLEKSLYNRCVRGSLAFDTGDFRTAVDDFQFCLDHVRDAPTYLHLMRQFELELLIFNRMYGRPNPPKEQVLQRFKRRSETPMTLIEAEFLLGETDLARSEMKAANEADADELKYYKACYELSIGQYEDSKSDLAYLVKMHPNWVETRSAKALLKWYEQQTPESLKALPKASALVPTGISDSDF